MEMHTNQLSFPLVSVCIPTYNASATIIETLNCVLNQTYKNIEIIVCDNQSTDRTVELIKKISDERIQIHINTENVGMLENFNIVLSKAKGKYVKLLCSDDRISSDCIEKQVNVFQNQCYKDIVMVSAEKIVIDEKGKQLFIKRFPGKGGFYDGEKALRKSFRFGTNIFGEPGSVLFLNEAVQKAGKINIPIELTYVVDLQLYSQILIQGNLFVLKEPLFSFRVTKNSYTANSKWESAIVFNKLRKKYTREKFVSFSFVDKILAFIMSWILCVLRNMIFKLTNKK